MENSKFIRLYKTLSAKEQVAFEHFVKGMYNGQILAFRLLKHIKNNCSAGIFPPTEKDLIVKKILKQPIVTIQQRKNVDNLLAKLYKYLKEYLVWQKISTQKEEVDFMMLNILQERKLDKIFFRKMYRLEQSLKKTKSFDDQNSLRLFQLNHLKFHHPNTAKINIKNQDLPKAMQHLDQFYVSMKLKLAAELINRTKVLQEQHTIPMLRSSLDFAKETMKDHPVIELWLLTIELLEKENETLFKELKAKVCHQELKISLLEQLIFLSYLINFASSEVKKGNLTFYQEAYDLYVFGIDKKLLIENGYFAPTKFNNIVHIACILKKFAWVKGFILKWGRYLPPNVQNPVIDISNAYALFEEGKFEETLKTIAHLTFNDPYIELRSRTLVLKSYFELFQFSNKHLILDYCKSFDNYLRRNLIINKITVASYRSLIQFIRKMLHKNNTYENVKNWYQQVPYIFSKPWIEEKINTLKLESSSLKNMLPDDSSDI